MDNYIAAITKSTLSKASIRQYVSKLNNLIDITKHDIEWILQHPKEVYNIVINTYHEDQSRKAYLVSVLALFKHVPDLKNKYKENYTKFFQYHKDVNNDVDERYRKGIANERQKKSYVQWEDVLKKRQELHDKDYGGIQHLLLSMYTYIPPLRQDFHNIKFVRSMPFGAKASKGNFMVLNKKSAVLVLNEFKTKHVFKHYHKELPSELLQIIWKSVDNMPRDYLFVDSNGGPYEKEDSFHKFVNRNLKEIFQKPVTVNTLRHSFILDERKRNVTPGEEADSAKDMLHSIAMKNNYRFRVDDP
jgi:hypothetical protein